MRGHGARTAIRRPGCKVLTGLRPSECSDTRIVAGDSSRLWRSKLSCHSCDGGSVLGDALDLRMEDPAQREHVLARTAHQFVVAVEVAAASRLDETVVLVDDEVHLLGAGIVEHAAADGASALVAINAADRHQVGVDQAIGLLLLRAREAQLGRRQRLARQLAQTVERLVEVEHGAPGLGVGRQRRVHERLVDAGLSCQLGGARRVGLAERRENTLRGVVVDLVVRREQIELSGGRPVIRGPARQAEREAQAAEVDDDMEELTNRRA